MRLTNLAAGVASLGLAAAGAIPRLSELSDAICANALFTGEVLHLSLNIIEAPVVVDVDLVHNAVVTIANTILIDVTNAPTRLHTTVYATTTATVTRTVSTATISAETVAGTTATVTAGEIPAQTQITVPSAVDSGNGNTIKTEINTKTNLVQPSSTTTATSSATSAITTEIAPVAGGSAPSHTTTTTTAQTLTSTLYGTSSSVIRTYTTPVAVSTPTPSAVTPHYPGDFTNWTTFKANGVNLGGWLEQEQVFDQMWWNSHAPDAADEWSFCETLGEACGPVLEERYASYVTTADIDRMAAVGINTLRIPTTYAAWISVPGSALYHGNQKEYLRRIAIYAVEKYAMRIIVGLHSLPGGVNSLDIGEKVGNDGWFFNSTNLAYSLDAVDAVLAFFVETGYPWAFTLAPLNEASDNPAAFASPNTLTANGTAWIVRYSNAVLARIARIDTRIPLMLQDCFLGEEHWSPLFPAGTNLVIDTHVYYFAASGVYSQWANGAICGQASVVGGDGKFPVFVGEWALQTLYSNSFENRKNLFETQRYAWSYYVSGGAFWNVKHESTAKVDGEGVQRDYWSFERLLDEGVVEGVVANKTYC
ncbi:glycoside hydrolase superfamily [Aspergillus pseudodeflectus]|uniref:glucan 1,3-beta-glucosidase n=1 Tax=Aspergillus pseudodeflectus TaxID=176178 RepID=A0ABR4LBD4_9EURO